MEAFREFNCKQYLLESLYITYLWIPLREKLLNDYENGKFVLLENTNAETKLPNQPEVLSVRDKPELIDNLLPKIGRLGRFYHKLSTIAHVFNFIATTMLIAMGNQLDFDVNDDSINDMLQNGIFSLPCIIPRMGIHRVFNQLVVNYSGYSAALLQLIWRFPILFIEKEFSLDTILFLLIDDKKIENSKDTRKALDIYHEYRTQELTQSIMLYKIEDKLHNIVAFRLRPNRTQEVRAKLMDIVKFGTKTIGFTLVPTTILASFVISWTFIVAPELAYIGCGKESFNLIHLYRFLGGTILCCIIAFDTMCCLAYPFFVSIIIIFDIKFYWNHVQSMLFNHLKLMVALRTLSDTYQTPDSLRNAPRSRARCFHHETEDITKSGELLIGNKHNLLPEIQLTTPRRTRVRVCHYSLKSSKFSKSQQPEVPTESLEAKNREIEAIVCDFFAQLRQADQYVSLTLAYAFCIWLSLISVILIMTLEKDTNVATTILLRSVQLVGLTILIVMTILILTLKRSTEPAYRTICSIMARDPSVEKRRWELLLNYYTGRPKHAFTLLHTKVYTLGLFLHIFSYTFTFSLYLQSFGIIDGRKL